MGLVAVLPRVPHNACVNAMSDQGYYAHHKMINLCFSTRTVAWTGKICPTGV